MKLPRTQAKLSALLIEEFQRSYQQGLTKGALEERKMISADLTRRQTETDLKAFIGVSGLVSSMSRAVEAITRAMYNGRGM